MNLVIGYKLLVFSVTALVYVIESNLGAFFSVEAGTNTNMVCSVLVTHNRLL